LSRKGLKYKKFGTVAGCAWAVAQTARGQFRLRCHNNEPLGHEIVSKMQSSYCTERKKQRKKVSYLKFIKRFSMLQQRTEQLSCDSKNKLELLRTTLPQITRSAPFPPVSSRGARSCRVSVSLPISTTDNTHETRYRVGPLASF
jgi:hypothetical protein